MAAPVGIFVMRDSSVLVDDVEYANQCTKVRLVPETPIQTVRTLVPDGIVQDVDSSAWTLELTCLQKNDTGGLAKVLRDATPGTQLDLEFLPKAGFSQPMATCTIIALPAPFGGDQGAFPTAELVFPVVGAPVFGTSPAS